MYRAKVWAEMRHKEFKNKDKDCDVFGRHPSRRFGPVALLPGMCQISAFPACPKILFLHFGVSIGTRDLKARERQSGDRPRSSPQTPRTRGCQFPPYNRRWVAVHQQYESEAKRAR